MGVGVAEHDAVRLHREHVDDRVELERALRLGARAIGRPHRVAQRDGARVEGEHAIEWGIERGLDRALGAPPGLLERARGERGEERGERRAQALVERGARDADAGGDDEVPVERGSAGEGLAERGEDEGVDERRDRDAPAAPQGAGLPGEGFDAVGGQGAGDHLGEACQVHGGPRCRGFGGLMGRPRSPLRKARRNSVRAQGARTRRCENIVEDERRCDRDEGRVVCQETSRTPH